MLRKYRSFFILGAILLAGLIGWLVYRELFTFYLKDTSPDSSSVSYASPYLKLNYNKDLKADGYKLHLTMNGDDIYVEHEIEEKTFKVYLPTDMGLNQQYSLSLENISSTDGKTLTTTINFTTQNIPYDKLDKEQQDELVRLQDALHINETQDPIAPYLPHGTLTYNLSLYIKGGTGTDVPGDRLIVRAEIMLSNADVRSGREEAITRTKTEINEWVRSVGLDPAAYTFEYTIREP